MSFALPVQAVLSGITIGFVYALIGLGIAVIFKGSKVVNAMQGEFAIVGGMTAAIVLAAGLPFITAIAAGIGVGALGGGLIQRFLVGPMIARKANEESMLLLTIGIAFTLSAAVLFVAGRGSHLLPAVGGNGVVELAGATIRIHAIFLMIAGSLLVGGLAVFFKHTVLGIAMTAAALDPDGATIVGINVQRMRQATFVLGGALGAIAGILVAPLTEVGYQMGLTLTLKGFAAAVVGGLTNPLGAVAGGLLIGLVESFGVVFIASGYKNVFAMTVLIFIMILVPNGILGRAGRAGG